MTASTTPRTGNRRSKQPPVAAIDAFRGRLISPHDTDYDSARAIWNGAIDRRPRLIARCIGTSDVIAAVRFARDHDLEIAIRGGGHNVAGTAVCDDGIVIDLSAMRAVRVDPGDRSAWVQGGALWGDVDDETQAHGLATTGGIENHTGVAGLTLGGGIGWLMRKHGLTVDNLLAASVVTADGAPLRASEVEHPDLFWALRGGRQLRRGHLVRVPPPPGRAHGPGRTNPLGRDRRRGSTLASTATSSATPPMSSARS